MKNLYLAVLLFLSIKTSSVFAQELPDTIFFFKTASIDTFSKCPSLSTENILYTLTLPEGFIYRNEEGELRILLKEAGKWMAWSLSENSSIGNAIDSIGRVRFGKGKDKLMIYWEHRNGRSGWESGFSETYTGIQLWDLENKTRILELQTGFDYQYWWTEYEEDTTNTIPYEEREVLESGGESSHYKSEVIIEEKKITINETLNEDNEQALSLCRNEYILDTNKLVLKKRTCK